MAIEHADTAVESFRELELRLTEFLRAVPFEPAHHRVFSPVLASLLLDACSLAESILKSTMDNARYNGVANIAQHRARRYAAARISTRTTFGLFFGRISFTASEFGFFREAIHLFLGIHGVSRTALRDGGRHITTLSTPDSTTLPRRRCIRPSTP